ncbi:MAG TPA: tetratricopeptide repeat protein [Cyclobacteriaceae bacterium]|nr:tetratricopeptide repeat protein [Cyclobacteriaceae bacterium]
MTLAQAPKKDTTIILLSDITVQIEITEALEDLYNFQFEKAEKQFRWLKQKYAWHPLPYFLMGMSEWWKIMPNPRETANDERFLAYMDSAIFKAEKLYRMPEFKVEASFFLSASYGFKGRLYSDEDRKQWSKAISTGKSALNYLEDSKGYHDLSPELLFGDALYNYFSVWVPENYSLLKPVLMFFPKGDKELGVKQLREVSYNAFYTRIEAMVWLMRILNNYENKQIEAFNLSEYLHKTYPDNPYFHRYYARMLYSLGRYAEMDSVATDILQKIESGKRGYEANSGRYAAFFLGQFYDARRNVEQSEKYYREAVRFAEAVDAKESGYYHYSLIRLGEISQKKGDSEAAKDYFKKVRKLTGRKDPANKQAKERMKKLEKGE